MFFRKIVTIALLLTIAIFVNVFQSNITFAKTTKPTKKETVSFILEKIAEVPSLHESHFDDKTKSVHTFSSDGCTLTRRYLDAAQVSYSIPIHKIVTNLFESQVKRDFVLELNCEGGSDCLAGNQLEPDGSKYSFRTHTISFQSSNSVVMGKLESAFRHLKHLCSGKKDLF